jgi:hypothetical protein
MQFLVENSNMQENFFYILSNTYFSLHGNTLGIKKDNFDIFAVISF